MATKSAQQLAPVRADNVVSFRLCLLPRHETLLRTWLEAGRCMGISDASIYPPEEGGPDTGYVLIWVRENTDPAYMISPDGTRWVVLDHVRQKIFARERSFDEALNVIRPLLPVPAAA